MPSFANKLKQLRIERNLTQQKLADALNVSQNAVYNWENGKREPNIETLKKIAAVLDVSLYNFLDEDLFDAATSSDAQFEEELIASKFESILENEKLSNKEKRAMVQDLISKLEIMQNMHESNAKSASKFLLNELFDKLNLDGQEKAIEHVEMLTKIPEYRKK